MRKIFIQIFTIIICATSYAQQNYFAYFQTNNRQAFSLQFSKDNIYSSDASGYLIISKMVPGNYIAKLNFPKDIWPKQEIKFNITATDIGIVFDLQNDDTWVSRFLVNNIDKENTETKTAQKEIEVIETKPENNIFAESLASATNDSSIVKQNEIKTNKKAKNTNPKNEIKTKPIVEILPHKQSLNIIKTQEILDAPDGANIIYLINYEDGKTEEIKILIPKKQLPKTKKPIVDTLKTEEKITKNEPIVEPTKLDESTTTMNTNENTSKKDVTNIKCSNVANADDFETLYSSLLATKVKDERLGIARKAFKQKCYLSDDIRSLAKAFRGKDKEVLDFLLLANRYTADTEEFIKLRDLVKEPENLEQFDFYIKK